MKARAQKNGKVSLSISLKFLRETRRIRGVSTPGRAPSRRAYRPPRRGDKRRRVEQRRFAQSRDYSAAIERVGAKIGVANQVDHQRMRGQNIAAKIFGLDDVRIEQPVVEPRRDWDVAELRGGYEHNGNARPTPRLARRSHLPRLQAPNVFRTRVAIEIVDAREAAMGGGESADRSPSASR